MYTLEKDLNSKYLAIANPDNSSNNKFKYILGLERGIKVLPDNLSLNGASVVSEKFLDILGKYNSTPYELTDIVLIPKYINTYVRDEDFNSFKSVLGLTKKMLGRTKFTSPIFNYKLMKFIDLDLYDNYFLDYVDFKNSRFNLTRGNPERIIKDLPNKFKIETRADVKWLKEFRLEYKETYVIHWNKVVFKNFSHLDLDIFNLPFSKIGWHDIYISDKFKLDLDKNNITGFNYKIHQ